MKGFAISSMPPLGATSMTAVPLHTCSNAGANLSARPRMQCSLLHHGKAECRSKVCHTHNEPKKPRVVRHTQGIVWICMLSANMVAQRTGTTLLQVCKRVCHGRMSVSSTAPNMNSTSEELFCLVQHQIEQRIVAFEHALHCMAAFGHLNTVLNSDMYGWCTYKSVA
jgi:hypothetical protein